MRIDPEKLKERIEAHFISYVGIQSDTGTVYERNIEEFYKKWFHDVPYFKENPEKCGLFKIPGDHLNRHIPWALLRGKGNETVVLLHHSDTVDTIDYGAIRDIALDPKSLEQAFKDGKMPLTEEAKADLESGEWLFGRGSMDMKGGAAIHIALMETYAEIADFKGNLLLLAAPDEENLSAGAIGAAYLLNDLKDKYQLEYKLCLLSEPDFFNRSIQNGSVGKMMPLIYVRGKIAHVGRVYDGLNPVKILSKIVDLLDLNPDFIETNGTTTTPAPTFLYAKDRKDIYDVSLPSVASGCISLYCFHRTPKELIELVREICEDAMGDAIESVKQSHGVFLQKSNMQATKLDWQVNVKLYANLYEEARLAGGDVFLSTIKQTESEVGEMVKRGEMTLIEASHVVIERTLAFVRDLSPVVVIALVPPYYPFVSNDKLPVAGQFANDIGDALLSHAKETDGYEYVKLFATGMCDFSYMMQISDKSVNDYIENNMMMWGNGYHIPFEKISQISMPILNIGPVGRDAHQYTERVLKKDIFYTIPDYTHFAISRALETKLSNQSNS